MRLRSPRRTLPWLALAALCAAWAAAASPPGGGRVCVIEADEEITLGLSAYTRRAFSRASDANLAVLRVDTLGGRVDAALEIVRHIEGAKPRVVAWVDDKAWSAGALLSLACGKVYMRKGASIGSAAPVSVSSEGKTEALGEKHVSALRARFRALAEKNGYPPLLAEAMVDRDVEVLRGLVEGKETLLGPEEAQRLRREGKVQGSTETVNGKGKLLNLSAEQAVRFGLAARAETLEEVLAAEGLAGAAIERVAKSPLERFVNFVTGTTAASLLVLLGFMLISVELNAPGLGWAGVGGAVCLGLVFFGHYLANLADMLDLLLILAGIALLVLEAFVVPGFGITGIAGFSALMAGLYLMVVPFVFPGEPWEFERLKEAAWILLAAFAGSVIGVVSLFAFIIRRMPMFNRPSPATASEGAAPPDRPAAGELPPGRVGLAVTDIDPLGRAQFGIHLVAARTLGGRIAKGTPVAVVSAGEVVTVRPAP